MRLGDSASSSPFIHSSVVKGFRLGPGMAWLAHRECERWEPFGSSACVIDRDIAARSSSSSSSEEVELPSSCTVGSGGLASPEVSAGRLFAEANDPANGADSGRVGDDIDNGLACREFGAEALSPTSDSASGSSASVPSRCRLTSTASSRSRCSRTVTPVVPGWIRWNFAINGTGLGAPVASVEVRWSGGGNSPDERVRVCLGNGTLITEARDEVTGSCWIGTSAVSTSSSQTRTFFRRVSSNGPMVNQIKRWSRIFQGDHVTFVLENRSLVLYR